MKEVYNLDNIVEVKNISKLFKNGVKAVDNLSLSINTGDVFGFLGPNGAGKTTTIRIILGLLKPDKGEIFINGYSVKSDYRNAVNNVGALIEGPAFYDYLSAKQNLEIFAKYSGVKNNKIINEILDIVGLKSRAKDKVKNYSLGMKQRLGIGQALLNNPKLIILDEPTNGLDPAGIKEIRNLISFLSNERKITILVSSHILSEIEQISNKIILINKGKKILSGKVEDLLKEKNKYFDVECKNINQLFLFLNEKKIMITKTSDNCVSINLGNFEPAPLLKELVYSGLEIISFSRAKNTLEDLFFENV
jgi:ABC-2 type transport system ATP-binding protein